MPISRYPDDARRASATPREQGASALWQRNLDEMSPGEIE
jgi:hypothetical protein